MKGRHQLKCGYRLVDRYPSPFTNTDTRGTINFGRNYTNNPVTNSGRAWHRLAAARLHQQWRARLPARALHDDPGARPVHPGRLQAQLPRFTVNAGLRYEIFTAETEEENRLTNYDPVNLRLIYAGEDGASAAVNKKTQYGNFAPRLGMTYDLLGDSDDDSANRLWDHLLSRTARQRRT